MRHDDGMGRLCVAVNRSWDAHATVTHGVRALSVAGAGARDSSSDSRLTCVATAPLRGSDVAGGEGSGWARAVVLPPRSMVLLQALSDVPGSRPYAIFLSRATSDAPPREDARDVRLRPQDGSLTAALHTAIPLAAHLGEGA